MADTPRVGKKVNNRDRKNGAAREAWQERKKERNEATGHQVYDLATKTYRRE